MRLLIFVSFKMKSQNVILETLSNMLCLNQQFLNAENTPTHTIRKCELVYFYSIHINLNKNKQKCSYIPILDFLLFNALVISPNVLNTYFCPLNIFYSNLCSPWSKSFMNIFLQVPQARKAKEGEQSLSTRSTHSNFCVGTQTGNGTPQKARIWYQIYYERK